MKNKKEKIIAILLVVGLIVVTGSISYAAFRFSGLGSKVNTITTGSITMSYTESSNVLSMSGALPTTDTTGKGRLNPGEYFDFTVSSSITGDTNINYEIAVEELSGSTMDGDFIKFYLTKLGTDGSEQGIFGPSTYTAETEANTYTGRPANMMSLYTSSMDSSETTTYRLRMYVSEEYNPQGDGGNLTYKARVNVYGLAGDKIESGEEEPVALAAGLYDENDVMLASWDEFVDDYGLDIEADYSLAGSSINMSSALTTAGLHSTVKKVIIPDGVTRIGNSAFSGCISIKEITIPDSVEYIGTNAFNNCNLLSSIYIPENVTTILGPSCGLFNNCPRSLKIYCAANEDQAGWVSGWNCYFGSSVTSYETIYGVSRAEYETMIAQ